MTIAAFTDYPIRELGDTPHVEAPVRPCEVLSWDGDKYCDVRVEGIVVNFKRWYLYPKPERLNSRNPNWLTEDVLESVLGVVVP